MLGLALISWGQITLPVAAWSTSLATIPSSTPKTEPAASPQAPQTRRLKVGLLASQASYAATSASCAWEDQGAQALLEALGCQVQVLRDSDLRAATLAGLELLVLPNSRCIDPNAVGEIQAWCTRGGCLLATEMASYRDLHNQKVGTDNTFQLGERLGVHFERWVSGWPRCEFLELEPGMALEVQHVLQGPQPVSRIQLGRNTAMLVSPLVGGQTLGSWLDADGVTKSVDAHSRGTALVLGADGRSVYCGENLLTPELSRSPEVAALLLVLLRRLVGPERAGYLPVHLAPEVCARVAGLAPPASHIIPLHNTGTPIRVGLQGGALRVVVQATQGLCLGGLQGTLPALGSSPSTSKAWAGQTAVVEVRKEGASAAHLVCTLGEQAFEGGQGPLLVAAAPSPAPPPASLPSMPTARLATFSGPPALEASKGPTSRPATNLSPTSSSPTGPSLGGEPNTTLYFTDERPNQTGRLQAVRGSLEITLVRGQMRLVNVVDLDSYVCGVVPNEVPHANPTEALRAMAVVARSFARHRLGYHGLEGFDVCSTVHCQMYGGLLTETQSTTQAVADTRGEVLACKQKAIDATFHAVCGGVGEAVERVWKQPAVPYLPGGPDTPQALPQLESEAALQTFIDHPPTSWCSTSPRFRWTESYSLAQLQALFEASLPRLLGSSYHGLGTLHGLRVTARTPLGRVSALEITGSQGTYSVFKDSIRWLWSQGVLGQGGLQSTLFYLDTSHPEHVIVRGGGWGHGVGMCQDGAAGMARSGLLHEEILRHYYPGASLSRPHAQEQDSPPAGLK